MKLKPNLIAMSLIFGAALMWSISDHAQPVTSVVAGNNFTLFVKGDGSLWGMGLDSYGQLGDGNTTFNTTVTPPEFITNHVAVAAAGSQHSLFIQAGGSLWGMGYNGNGGLGDGTYNNQPLPEEIVPDSVIAAGAGYNDSLFLKNDGSLWAMGYNNYGELGDNFIRVYWYTNTPECVVSNGVTALAVGSYHTLFLKSDGSLWGMGEDFSGELGDGTGSYSVSVPKKIVSSGVVAIAAGGAHSLFIKSDGSLWAMGDNSDGELGDGTANPYSLVPERIVANGVTAIAAGAGGHSLFLKSDGSLWAMGYNGSGELGDGTFNSTNRPEQILAGGVTAIAAGGGFSLFIKNDGSLWGTGNNSDGQLGLAPFYATNTPVQIVAGPPGYNQLKIRSLSGSLVSLSMIGIPTANYALDVTPTLNPANWIPVITNTSDINGLVTFTNPTIGASNTFWRARGVP